MSLSGVVEFNENELAGWTVKVESFTVKRFKMLITQHRASLGTSVICALPSTQVTRALVTADVDNISSLVIFALILTRTFLSLDTHAPVKERASGALTAWETVAGRAGRGRGLYRVETAAGPGELWEAFDVFHVIGASTRTNFRAPPLKRYFL